MYRNLRGIQSVARVILFLPFVLCGQVNVLTANYDNNRTNSNLQETVLTTSNVHPGGFGKLGVFPVDGLIYAQPLYITGVNIPGQGLKNVLYVATMHDSVFAFDADATGSPAPLWHVNFGQSVPPSVFDCWDFDSEMGILSTPVIDPSRNAIFVVSDTFENSVPVFRLHALDLADGHEKLGGPVEIKATVSGYGDGNQNGVVILDPVQHIQRPGLLLLNDRVYVAFGSHCDQYPYHGWIVSYDASNVQEPNVIFNVTPNSGSGSIWQSGRGLAVGSDGNIYVATGNGYYDGETEFAQSFIKLSSSLALLDWFAPADWQELSDVDHDVGSLGPVLVPDQDLLIGGDKDGNLYVVNRQNMGHLGVDGVASPQIFPAVGKNGIFDIALWDHETGPITYVIENGNWTAAFRIVGGHLETNPFSKTDVTSDYPFQGMTVSADGSKPGTGILWMTTGDHFYKPGIPGTLHAFDALDLNRELWNSDMNPRGDPPGVFAKFVSPTVVNGHVYVPTFSNQVAVYGLISRQTPKHR
jgi:hypothetical protein